MSSLLRANRVSVVLCHRHVPMALACLGSVQRYCHPPPGFRIHDDGTLTDDDIARLHGELDDVRVIRRSEADARLVAEHPECRELHRLRGFYPQIMKAFDARVFCDEALFASMDSDVLFLRDCESPFALDPDGARARIMQDREPSYSLRSWQKALSWRLRLPARTNSGLFVFRAEDYRLDLAEAFVRNPLHQGLRVIEQTCTSMLALRAGCEVYDPTQIRVMRAREDDESLLAGHFTARTRGLLPEFIARALRRAAEQASPNPEAWRFVPPGRCTALDLLRYELRRLGARLQKELSR